MLAFFEGWQRKTGCVALLVALAFMALWIRSFVFFDQIAVGGNFFISNSGCFVWNWQGWGGPDSDLLDWYRDTASPFSEDWYFGSDGLRLPYYALVIPATLLSAGLLLWKPGNVAKGSGLFDVVQHGSNANQPHRNQR